MPSFSAKAQPAVVVMTFSRAKLLDVAGPLQVFVDAVDVGGIAYETAVVSLSGQNEMTDARVSVECQAASHWYHRKIDTLLIAGGAGRVDAEEDPVFVAAVARLAMNSRRVGSICTGAFILAAAGLLDGRDAVTHWASCAALAAKFPKVNVIPDRIFVNDGRIWTSAGVTAGIDMALAMVAEDSGRKVALDLARSLVTFMVRPGGQSQYSEILVRQTEDATGRFDGLHDWIARNLNQDLRIEALSERAGMSARSFARIYVEETGQTPAKSIEAIRVGAARRFLEETDEPTTTIARKTGFIDDERLRRAMKRVLGLSPKDYRQRFRAQM